MQPEPAASTLSAVIDQSNPATADTPRLVRVETRHTAQEDILATPPAGALPDGDAVTNLVAADVLVHGVIAQLRTSGPDEQVTIANLQADAVLAQATIEQLERDGIIDRDKIENLKQALVTARRIGAAIGIIMAVKKVTEEQAFTVLCQNSQRSNRKLRDIADIVVMTGAV